MTTKTRLGTVLLVAAILAASAVTVQATSWMNSFSQPGKPDLTITSIRLQWEKVPHPTKATVLTTFRNIGTAVAVIHSRWPFLYLTYNESADGLIFSLLPWELPLIRDEDRISPGDSRTIAWVWDSDSAFQKGYVYEVCAEVDASGPLVRSETSTTTVWHSVQGGYKGIPEPHTKIYHLGQVDESNENNNIKCIDFKYLGGLAKSQSVVVRENFTPSKQTLKALSKPLQRTSPFGRATSSPVVGAGGNSAPAPTGNRGTIPYRALRNQSIVTPARNNSAMSSSALRTQMETDTDRLGGDYRSIPLSEPQPALCQNFCASDARCQSWTYVKPGIKASQAMCYLKNIVLPTRHNTCCVSGVR